MSHEDNDKPNAFNILEETVEGFEETGVMNKMEFAVHLMNRLPISFILRDEAEVTEGYDYDDWEESMAVIKLLLRRYKNQKSRREVTPEFMKKIMFGITNELRRYEIGCLDCSYREYMDTIEKYGA